MTDWLRYICFGALSAGCLMITGSAGAQSISPEEGMRIFKSANCVGCHKWTGEGGGGYGGAAANLRRTQLSEEEIEQTVRCGRPMTGMPHFEAVAYSDGRCYGLKSSDLPEGKMPPEPDHPLRPADIKKVVAYVVASVKGKGDPDYAQCQAFFGNGSRVCNTYPKQGGGNGQVAATAEQASGDAQHVSSGGQEASGGGTGASSGPMKVERAIDANAPGGRSGK